MIQSANTLLFNIGKASHFRKELFTTHKVESIYNLSAFTLPGIQKDAHKENVCCAGLRSHFAQRELLTRGYYKLYKAPSTCGR